MVSRTYIDSVRATAKLVGALFLATLVPVVLPAAAAHWPASGAQGRKPQLAMLGLRVPSPGDMALEGRSRGDQLPPRDRLVALENANTKEKATFYVGAGGYVRSDQTAALEYFFRCQHTGRQGPINRRLVEILADIAEHYPGRVIEFLSGFRTAPFGAPKSRHFIGHAIDLRVRGVPSTQVRDFVWREHRGLGVGHYPAEDFVHVDTRAGEPEIAWSGRDESTRFDYNPRWAALTPAPPRH